MRNMGRVDIRTLAFFITVVIFGNFILMKLFLAILIQNFSEARMVEKVKIQKKK